MHPGMLEKDKAGLGSIPGNSSRALPVLGGGKVALRDPLNREKRGGKRGIELKFLKNKPREGEIRSSRFPAVLRAEGRT